MTDHLNNEVSVSAALTETGISGKTKSRAVSALDRLVGNIFDWPNPLFEARRIRIEFVKV